MPKLKLLLLLKQVVLPPTVSATDHPGTAIIHGYVTWRLRFRNGFRHALLTLSLQSKNHSSTGEFVSVPNKFR